MKPNKADVDAFFRNVDAVALVAPAAELFGLLSRSLRLPTGVAALVTREAGDRVMVRAGAEIAGDEAAEVMFLRVSPLELRIVREGLTSKDHYLCGVDVTLSVTAVPERSEAESFRRTILGSRRGAYVAALAQRLEPLVTPVLADLAEQHEVEDLVDGKCRERAVEAIRGALATPCFQAGLSLDGPITVAFDSEALRDVRAKAAQTALRLDEHAAQQQLDDALSAARARHLDALEGTLRRLKTLADESPAAALPDLLRTFNETERAKLYQALFESQKIAPATQWLVVASGQELLFFSPESPEAPARRMTLEGEIGPLRSIQAAVLPEGGCRLLAGASRGVYDFAVDGSDAPVTYSAAALGEVRGGVNSVALCGTALFATHSEHGLLRWDRRRPEAPARCCEDLTRGAEAVRGVHLDGDRVVFSVDRLVVSFSLGSEADRRIYSGSGSTITAALANGPDLFAGNADGQILHWTAGDTTSPRVLHGGSRRAAESVALLTAAGVSRLFYTDTTLAVFARVLGDTFVCRYEAGGQTLRRVEVAADLIVATNDQRDRLLLWRPNRPSQPIANLHVARLTNHSVQDATLVPLET